MTKRVRRARFAFVAMTITLVCALVNGFLGAVNPSSGATGFGVVLIALCLLLERREP